MLPPPPFRLKSRLAGGAAANPHYANMARKALLDVGFPAATNFGSTKVSDTALDHSVKLFQKANDLKPDGVINPGGETEHALNQILAVRPDLERPLPSSSRKTILTGRDLTPTVKPRTPPGKPNTGSRINPTAGMPKRGQARPNPVTQPLRQAIETAFASDEVYSDNGRMAKAAMRTYEHGELARSHAFAVSEFGDDAVGELVDFGKQLFDAEPESFASWIEAMAGETWQATQQILTAMFWIRSAAPDNQAASSTSPPTPSDDPRQILNALIALKKKGFDKGNFTAERLLKSIIDSNRETAAQATAAARDANEGEDGAQNQASDGPLGPRPTHRLSKAKQDNYLDRFTAWLNEQPKRSENTAFLAGPPRIQSSGPGDHRREAGSADPDRAARRRVVDWTQATETRQDFIEIIEKFRERGWHFAAYLLQHYIDGSGNGVTVPAELARKAPGVIAAAIGAQKHFERWFTNSGNERERKDTKFGNIFDFINPKNKEFMSPEDRREWDITGMIWKGTGGSSDDIDATDAHLSFGGATVVAVVTSGKLIRQSDGTVTIEAVVEFHAEDTYNFTKERGRDDPNSKPETPSSLPTPAAVHGSYFISPAHTIALEKTGGAKQFEVTSETWTRQLSGTIEADSHQILAANFDWDEIP